MPRGVQEDPEGLARLHLVPAGADCDHGGLPGVEVVDLEVEVDLLRVLGPGQRGGRWSATRWKASGVPPAGASCTQSASARSTVVPRTAA